MICLPMDEVRAGMVLAKSILSDHGDLLLAAGFNINHSVLVKMREMGMSGCWIYQEGTEYVIPEESINEQLALQARQTLRENAELLKQVLGMRETTMDNVRKALSEPRRFRNIIAVEKFMSTVREILLNLASQEPVALNLNSLRTKSGYYYQHSLDAAITAVLIAQKFGLPYGDLEALALGCLLMDTGMVILSDQILQKAGPLSEEARLMLQEHPAFGYAILRENRRISLTTAHVAYQHHEHQDGHGYPRGLKGDNRPPLKQLNGDSGRMHRFAEIAAVADAYVSWIAPPPGEAAKSPDEAVKLLLIGAGSHLNKAVVDALVDLIPIFPTGARVAVTEDRCGARFTGYTGVVAKTRRETPDKPIILLLQDRERQKITPLPLDLAEEDGVKIRFCKL